MTHPDEPDPAAGPIIVFDALCVMCSAGARFVLRHDHARRFRLASAQSPTGAALFRAHGIDPGDPDTMILVDGSRALRNADAVLAILAGCGWPWRGLAALRIVPRPLRDGVYRVVARNRYRLFGRREACWLPSAADRGRFV